MVPQHGSVTGGTAFPDAHIHTYDCSTMWREKSSNNEHAAVEAFFVFFISPMSPRISRVSQAYLYSFPIHQPACLRVLAMPHTNTHTWMGKTVSTQVESASSHTCMHRKKWSGEIKEKDDHFTKCWFESVLYFAGAHLNMKIHIHTYSTLFSSIVYHCPIQRHIYCRLTQHTPPAFDRALSFAWAGVVRFSDSR